MPGMQEYDGMSKKRVNHQGSCGGDGPDGSSSEVNYHSLFEQATDPVLVTDFLGNFTDINSSFCALFGYSKAELLKMNIRALLEPGHLQSHPIRFDLISVGENQYNERKMMRKDKSIIYVEANARKLNDQRILVIARDVTERKRVENILQKSEANLQTIFQNTDTVYVLVDNDLRIISYNRRAVDFAERELGHSFMISEFLLAYFSEDKRETLSVHMKAVLSGKTVSYEIKYPQTDGKSNWYHVRIFPISKDDRDILGLMMAVSDITENKFLEQQLLEQKVQEQKRIIRAVIKMQESERNKIGQELHDNVNQILSAIRLYLGILENRPADRKEIVDKTKSFIDDAIAEIRELSRRQVSPQKRFDLKDSIEDLVKDMNEHAGNSTRFTFAVSPDLQIDEDLKLNIYRIVQEEVNNILRYSDAADADIKVVQNEKILEVTICDNGKGFDVQQKRKGIGISNIINRVESYNGIIDIVSSRGAGCRIAISIPLVPVHP